MNTSWNDTAKRRPDQERATACPVALEQKHPERAISGSMRQVIGEVRTRNVAEKRGADGHMCHIEIGISTVRSSRTDYVGASLALTRDDTIDFAAAMLGVNRDVVLQMVESIHG